MQVNTFNKGDEVTGFYMLKKVEVKHTNATPPKPYLDMIFGDQSGEISAKLWDASIEAQESLRAPMLVKIKGLVQSYRDQLQFRVDRIRPATESDGVKMTDYVRAAPVALDELKAAIRTAFDSIENLHFRKILTHCLNKAGDKLWHYPAASSIHHAYYAGLAYHMTRMLELAEFICKQRPYLNRDLLVSGIILHDIAKTVEMDATLGIVSDYSLLGKLHGHIALVYGWVTEAVVLDGEIDAQDEQVIGLQHLLLSHHNLGEWGSPVQPQLPEAVALHYIDQLDAKLQAVEDALQTVPEDGQWTAPITAIERKAIYKMKR